MTAKWYKKPKGNRRKKHLKKPNATCNSHSAIISAQRCCSKLLSGTASSSFLLTQDSPDIPTDSFFAGCPRHRAQQDCPAQPSPALPAAPMRQVPAVPPRQRVPSRATRWPPATGGISGLSSPPQGSGQGLLPFLHTLLVTRVQEVIYKPSPSSERPIRH